MRRARHISGWFLLSLAGLACGGSNSDSDAPACGDFEACGGNLEGGWKLTEACFIVLEQPKLSFCDTATADLHAKNAEGSVTFEKETYVRHTKIETVLTLNLPETCKQQGDQKKACADFTTTLSNGATLLCDDADGGGCECNATLMSTLNDSGGYSISGNRATLAGDRVDYCVKDETLTLRPTSSIQMSGTSGVTSIMQTTFEKN